VPPHAVPLRRTALSNPALFSFPIGFLCCWLGTVLSREGRAERSYHELHVRAETGIGAY
jgi:cation/acetate symporter